MNRHGPKRTGNVEPFKRADGSTYFRARIRLDDDSRVRVDVPAKYSTPAGGKSGRERAALYAEARQEREDETHELLNEKRERETEAKKHHDEVEGETCDAWFGRYYAYQRELGLSDVGKKKSRWQKWVSPVIGPKPIAAITRNDVEDVRDELDKAIEAWKRLGKSSGKRGREIGGKTAMNVWTALTSSFKAATSSKRRDLRVLEGRMNPCLGVEPPGDKTSRQARRKTFVHPREAAALLACETVPREWREVYAIALYSYLRPGELRVLTWEDVDLNTCQISVTKAWDYSDEKIKAPKSLAGVRMVPIEPMLMPLLDRMKEAAGDDSTKALVVPRLSSFGEDHLAEQFRRHLKIAKVERVELHRTTTTHVQSNFRSCRDSGITWLAMTGLGIDKIMRRAGHEKVDTTLGYVKQTEDLTGDLGTPFGPLPATLTGDHHRAKHWAKWAGPINKVREYGAGGGSRTPVYNTSNDESRTARDESPIPEHAASARMSVEVGPSAECMQSPRGAAISELYHHASALAAAGDIGAAKAVHDTLAKLLGSEETASAKVVDLNSKRRTRGDL